jgi:hypothetical protein
MTGHDRPGKLITTNIVPVLREILLADDTWAHIQKQHPEFKKHNWLYDAVVETLIAPTSVHQSTTRADSLVFLNVETTNESGDALKVPVGLKPEQIGFVRTAYFSGSKSPGILIWSKT